MRPIMIPCSDGPGQTAHRAFVFKNQHSRLHRDRHQRAGHLRRAVHRQPGADRQAPSVGHSRAVSHAEPCNTVKNGCPGFSGDAKSTPLAYAYTDDMAHPGACPNPPPPQ